MAELISRRGLSGCRACIPAGVERVEDGSRRLSLAARLAASAFLSAFAAAVEPCQPTDNDYENAIDNDRGESGNCIRIEVPADEAAGYRH
jgi:hypothetical protein